jgi:hypothetical protein
LPEIEYPDAAKRMANSVTMFAFLGEAGKWAAYALADGSSPDNTAYDTREECVRFQKWDRDNFVYVMITPDGMEPRAAMAFLRYARQLHDAGFRLPDPENLDKIPTMPLTKQDQREQIRALTGR